MKKWQISGELSGRRVTAGTVSEILLANRGIISPSDINQFLSPVSPRDLTAADVEIGEEALGTALGRIRQAVASGESIVVYADYDADGVSAGAVMWEALYSLGARVMPYIPHRVEEGYGLSNRGIDQVNAQYHPGLIITVDHGITGKEKIAYARSLGIDVVVTDHHVAPESLPDCPIVHTTKLCGAGVAWFVVKELLQGEPAREELLSDLLAIATIGTIADLVPLVSANRSIVSYGLSALRRTKRVGLLALMREAGVSQGEIGTYEVSHVLAPRLNAMGRMDHALDALRLLCARNGEKAVELAQKLGATNRERQQLTVDTTLRATDLYRSEPGASGKNLIFLADDSFNQGIIGLVAGKLVEEFYRPAIVVSRGDQLSKASARSIPGFSIVQAIRACADILVDVGGHPMAAGFTVETRHLPLLKKRLQETAGREITADMLERILRIDCELPFALVGGELWEQLNRFAPFGFGNPEPVFATRQSEVVDVRLVGADKRHAKFRLAEQGTERQAIAFGLGAEAVTIRPADRLDIAYSVGQNTWNGTSVLQLKIRDIHR